MKEGEIPAREQIGIRPITDREFTLFQELIYKEAGIYLAPVKRSLLEGRLARRLREHPDNRPGADKTWVERCQRAFREHYAKARRIR